MFSLNEFGWLVVACLAFWAIVVAVIVGAIYVF